MRNDGSGHTLLAFGPGNSAVTPVGRPAWPPWLELPPLDAPPAALPPLEAPPWVVLLVRPPLVPPAFAVPPRFEAPPDVTPPIEAPPPRAVVPAPDEPPLLPPVAPPAPPAVPSLLPPLALPLVPPVLALPALPPLAVDPPSAEPVPPADSGSLPFEVSAQALASARCATTRTGTQEDGRCIDATWLHARTSRIDRRCHENWQPGASESSQATIFPV